eukprot:COSAG02_NODE_3019_length_7535_cov_9.178456_9_plen_863_part_01
MIGYTSFEEPVVVGVSPVPTYVDTQGYDTEGHFLSNNDHQNPVSYVAGSVTAGVGSGAGQHIELGFTSFYCSSLGTSRSDRLSVGAHIGVIGDTTTAMNGNSGQGGIAPDGSQYYALEETGGFITVSMDVVSVVGYSALEMRAYVHVESAQWGSTDRVRVWASEMSRRSGDDQSGTWCGQQASASTDEIVLLDGSPSRFVDGGSVGTFNLDMWQEYSAPIRDTSSEAFEVVAMNFGMRSNSRFEQAWFDYFRIISSSSTCGGRGRCGDGDEESSECICDDGYYGAHCRIFCDPVITCSGHGTCDSSLTPRAGQCDCHENYYGAGCETYCTRAEACGGRGSCNPAGGCTCDDGWTGSRCDRDHRNVDINLADSQTGAYQPGSANSWMVFDVVLEVSFLIIGLILTFDGYRCIRVTICSVGFVVGGIVGVLLASESLYDAHDGINMWHGLRVPHPVYLIVAGLVLGCLFGAVLLNMTAHPATMFIVGFVCGTSLWALGAEATLGRQDCAEMSACDELQLHGAWNRTDALAHLGEGASVAQFGARSWIFTLGGCLLSVVVGFSFLNPAQGSRYHITGVRKPTTLIGVACLGAVALSGSLLVLLGRCIGGGEGGAWASIGSPLHACLAVFLAVIGVLVQYYWKAQDYTIRRGRIVLCRSEEEKEDEGDFGDEEQALDSSRGVDSNDDGWSPLSDRLYRTCCPPCAVYSRDGLHEATFVSFCCAWLCCCIYTDCLWRPRDARAMYHNPDMEGRGETEPDADTEAEVARYKVSSMPREPDVEAGKRVPTLRMTNTVEGISLSDLQNLDDDGVSRIWDAHGFHGVREKLLASDHSKRAFELNFPKGLSDDFPIPFAVTLCNPRTSPGAES